VILVPGTAIPAGIGYQFSFAKLLAASTFADPVWINAPNSSLGDVQVTSEFVAYAINYISSVCGNAKVSVLSWSQGGLNTQWALKYWPSTRPSVEDFIAISPDFDGTILAPILCPDFPVSLVCVPSFVQQTRGSKFIQTLRANGGDSAYVPTTTVFTQFDEIVQPQSGSEASAIIGDARGVGVTNNELQHICSDRPAGRVYTHESSLVNPLSWALAQDALQNQGPGSVSRIQNLREDVCNSYLAPGLELHDFLGTEGFLVVAVSEIAKYKDKTNIEPPIKNYAL
jgi:hypothetical protein